LLINIPAIENLDKKTDRKSVTTPFSSIVLTKRKREREREREGKRGREEGEGRERIIFIYDIPIVSRVLTQLAYIRNVQVDLTKRFRTLLAYPHYY